MISNQNDIYQAYTDNELAIVLSRFNRDYVFNVVRKSMDMRNLLPQGLIPNLVMGFEAQFKEILASYPLESDKINDIRRDTYETIIKIICDRYGLIFDDGNQTDVFSSALYMYEFFISHFRTNIINFFSTYIFQERNSLCDLLGTYDKKDIITSYNKKLYKNSKYGLISANIDLIINNICAFDIPLSDYIEISEKSSNASTQRLIAQHLNNILVPTGDFFKESIVPVFLSEFRQNIITDIRIELQSLVPDAELNTADYIKEEEN